MRDENDETFTVMLSNASGAGAGIGTRSATAKITDNDVPEMSIADATARERVGGSIVFDVSLSLASDLVISASYTTGSGSATAGSDFTAASGTVMFAVGAQTARITIDLIDDSTAESSETFTVTLSSPSSTASLDDAMATGTIEDDDRSFTLDIAGGGNVDEGDDATFTVTLTPQPASATPTEEIMVDWATEDGTATTAGSDYTAGSDTLTFALGGARTKQFTVATTHDTRDENDEDFTVTLSSASGASARIGTDTATATIRDNDVPVMSIANATANESDGTITFDVSLSPASDLAITATYATGNRDRGRRHGLHRAGGGQQHGQVQSRRDHRADQHRPDQRHRQRVDRDLHRHPERSVVLGHLGRPRRRPAPSKTTTCRSPSPLPAATPSPRAAARRSR